MRFTRFSKGLGLSAILIALCALEGNATVLKITMGDAPGAVVPLNYLSTTPGVAADPLNPNLFPVYFAESATGNFGFLLDGSEWSNTLMKRFEDAHAKGSNVTIYYDDGPGFKHDHSLWGQRNPGVARRIVYISTATID
jgi:hypothetical protein